MAANLFGYSCMELCNIGVNIDLWWGWMEAKEDKVFFLFSFFQFFPPLICIYIAFLILYEL